jgi:hypothetical protein
MVTSLEEIRQTLNASDELLWFRGCSNHCHPLLPSLMRDTQGLSDGDHDQVEQDLYFSFQARAWELRNRGLSDWEYLFYSRHYGMPTRVLDWTDTFGVALYFALERIAATHSDTTRLPAVWVMNPCQLNQETWGIRDIILPKYLGLDHESEYWDFGELLADQGEWSWDGPVAIYPIQINERVRAQRGWFTIHGNDRKSLDDQLPSLVAKLVLMPECIQSARQFIELAGFNRFSIYPDLDNLATWLREGALAWSEAAKLDRFWLESSARIPRLGGAETMKASRFSDAQKAFILKQGVDGMPVAEICRKAGISQATYFNWKKKYDGLLPTEMRRLKQLEDENGKLRSWWRI